LYGDYFYEAKNRFPFNFGFMLVYDVGYIVA